ncbi:MAG TPA: alpha/beta fold hydrolase [Spirochaetota bacterium]|nr:alpha/beta fold hydrolase [Spirochaetota bacterium]HPI89601.1 alpha/beta fold hydrolase [Spirochaetota bacterium]HPR48060.1 alpha/beta fold hydrolase [Spirochaetota bacterium]
MPLKYRESTAEILYKSHKVVLSYKYHQSQPETIIFIHGLGCSTDCFNSLWKYDSFHPYSLILFDLPGFGESPAVAGLNYGVTQLAEIIKIFLRRFPINTLNIVGHSMGNAVGLMLAGITEHTINSFISVEGNLFSSDCTVSRNIPAHFNRNDLARLSQSVKHTGILHHDRGMRYWSQSIALSDPGAFSRTSADLVRTTESGILMKKFFDLPCKKFYIYGEKNSAVIPLEKIRGVPLIKIQGSGHFPMIDNPDEFYTCLLRCIATANDSSPETIEGSKNL